jgi:hypothetical protein
VCEGDVVLEVCMAKGRLWGARSGSGEGGGERKDHGGRIEARPCDLKGREWYCLRVAENRGHALAAGRRKCGPPSVTSASVRTREQ